jgi:hypothetical protein
MTQAMNLANFANSLDTSGGVNPSVLNAAVPISKGGTGATTAANAAANLIVEIGKLIFPVGSIYTNASVSTNPATLLGFGTWVAFGTGQVAVGINSSDTSFNTLGQTGGSKDAVIPSHTHTASSTSTVTDPGHKHQFYQKVGSGYLPSAAGNETNGSLYDTTTSTTGISVATSTTVTSTGVSPTNNNLQPYVVVAMWKRTA